MLSEWRRRQEQSVSDWWCRRFHKKDHVCWDNMTPDPLPGDEVWFCNKCKRSWTAPNFRPDRCMPSYVGAEYQTAYMVTPFGPTIRTQLERLRKQRKDKDAKPNHK